MYPDISSSISTIVAPQPLSITSTPRGPTSATATYQNHNSRATTTRFQQLGSISGDASPPIGSLHLHQRQGSYTSIRHVRGGSDGTVINVNTNVSGSHDATNGIGYNTNAIPGPVPPRVIIPPLPPLPSTTIPSTHVQGHANALTTHVDEMTPSSTSTSSTPPPISPFTPHRAAHSHSRSHLHPRSHSQSRRPVRARTHPHIGDGNSSTPLSLKIPHTSGHALTRQTPALSSSLPPSLHASRSTSPSISASPSSAATSDELPDLGAFAAVLRAWGDWQPPHRGWGHVLGYGNGVGLGIGMNNELGHAYDAARTSMFEHASSVGTGEGSTVGARAGSGYTVSPASQPLSDSISTNASGEGTLRFGSLGGLRSLLQSQQATPDSELRRGGSGSSSSSTSSSSTSMFVVPRVTDTIEAAHRQNHPVPHISPHFMSTDNTFRPLPLPARLQPLVTFSGDALSTDEGSRRTTPSRKDTTPPQPSIHARPSHPSPPSSLSSIQLARPRFSMQFPRARSLSPSSVASSMPFPVPFPTSITVSLESPAEPPSSPDPARSPASRPSDALASSTTFDFDRRTETVSDCDEAVDVVVAEELWVDLEPEMGIDAEWVPVRDEGVEGGGRSTVWGHRGIAAYLESTGEVGTTTGINSYYLHESEETEGSPMSSGGRTVEIGSDHVSSETVSEIVMSRDVTSTITSDFVIPTSPDFIFPIVDSMQQPSLGSLDAALLFIKAERARWSASRARSTDPDSGYLSAHLSSPHRKKVTGYSSDTATPKVSRQKIKSPLLSERVPAAESSEYYYGDEGDLTPVEDHKSTLHDGYRTPRANIVEDLKRRDSSRSSRDDDWYDESEYERNERRRHREDESYAYERRRKDYDTPRRSADEGRSRSRYIAYTDESDHERSRKRDWDREEHYYHRSSRSRTRSRYEEDYTKTPSNKSPIKLVKPRIAVPSHKPLARRAHSVSASYGRRTPSAGHRVDLPREIAVSKEKTKRSIKRKLKRHEYNEDVEIPIGQNKQERLKTLAKSLKDAFPEERDDLDWVINRLGSNVRGGFGRSYGESGDEEERNPDPDPRGRPPRRGDTLIHVFIDHSNILIGLLYHLRRLSPRKSLRATKSTSIKHVTRDPIQDQPLRYLIPLPSFATARHTAEDPDDKTMSKNEKGDEPQKEKGEVKEKKKIVKQYLWHAALALILERGRPVSRRVIVTSSPLYQPMDGMEKLGYEVRVFLRVPDVGSGADRAKGSDKEKEKTNLSIHKRQVSGVEAKTTPASLDTSIAQPCQSNNDNLNDPPLSAITTTSTTTSTSFVTSTTNTNISSTTNTTTRIRYREQGVDELLQLKLHQALAATDDVPEGATIVLATGDGNAGQFNDDGFLGPVRTALRRGWRVELYAWEVGLSRAWRREFGEWSRNGMFRIIGMEQFASRLVEAGGL